MSLTTDIAHLTSEVTALTARVAGWLDEADARWQQVQQQLQQSVVLNNVTLEVGPGKQFATLQDAWNHIASAHLRGWVTIQVSPGVHEIAGGFFPNHQPWGAHVRIIGDLADPDNCVLRFVPGDDGKTHGLHVYNTPYIEISGFRIETAEPDASVGLLAADGAFIRSQPGTLKIHGFKIGLAAWGNASIIAEASTITGTQYGIYTTHGGYASASRSTIVGRGRTVSLCAGVLAADISLIALYGADVSGCARGIVADNGGRLWCDGSTAIECEVGFWAKGGGLVWCHQNDGDRPVGRASNCTVGWVAESGGVVFAPGAVADGCTTGFWAVGSAHMLVNEGAARNCQTGYQAERMSLIEAWNTQANLTGNTTDYGLAHGTAGNYGAMILYS